MELNIKINLDNDAFLEDDELTKILKELSEKFIFWSGRTFDNEIIKDSNGNRVGVWSIVESKK